MRESKLENKKAEAPSLEMARQTLGQVKELELTAKEKKMVNALIDQAKDFEAKKELGKALNIYNQVLKLMKEKKAEQEREGDLVDYHGNKILYPQAKFLEEIVQQIIEAKRKQGKNSTREHIRELISYGPTREHMRVDDIGNIVSLSLAGFDLNEVPDLIVLKKIENLDCSSNQLAALPGLNHLTELRYLRCGDNHLESLPDLSEVTELRELRCENNKLRSLPDLSRLKHIKMVDLHGNEFSDEEIEDIRKKLITVRNFIT
ncbi:MAG: leucine-rich repeat domain-containing protein [Candidatus Parcubacteria bacterium]|nr:leucine-rich repeat domain-containing protein [Candidatus Parcubacteria bacterium]